MPTKGIREWQGQVRQRSEVLTFRGDTYNRFGQSKLVARNVRAIQDDGSEVVLIS